MLTRRFTLARVAASLLALTILASCSDTSTTSPTGPSPFGAARFVVIPTPAQIIAGPDLGAFTNTINPNESGRLTTEFWDNVSSDNSGTSHCNIGFFATGTIGTSCLNAAAGSNANAGGGFVNYWGDNGAPAGAGQDASSFLFSGTFEYNVTLKGSYAGAGSTVGWFTKTGTTYTFHPVAAWSAKTINTVVNIPIQAAGTNWGFFINTLTPQPGGCGGAANPNFACTDATGSFTAAPNQQFALMTNATATTFLVGTEDNELKLLGDLPNPSLHDSDYNDYIFSIVPVIPPPPICDFITFGRLVTTVGEDKVVISGNAGGNAPDGGILGEIEISIGGTQYHVSTIESYGLTTNAPLFPDPFARRITGHSGNNLIELRLHDNPNPGQGEPGTEEGDKVWLKINSTVVVPTQTIDQGNIQLHLNCRGPGN